MTLLLTLNGGSPDGMTLLLTLSGGSPDGLSYLLSACGGSSEAMTYLLTTGGGSPDSLFFPPTPTYFPLLATLLLFYQPECCIFVRYNQITPPVR
jgi:hypothetical protein